MAPLRARQPELRRRGHHLRRPRRPAGAVGRGLVLPRRLSAACGRPRLPRLPRRRPPSFRRARRGGDRHCRVRALPVGVRGRSHRGRGGLGRRARRHGRVPLDGRAAARGARGLLRHGRLADSGLPPAHRSGRDHARGRRDLRAQPQRLHGRRLGGCRLAALVRALGCGGPAPVDAAALEAAPARATATRQPRANRALSSRRS